MYNAITPHELVSRAELKPHSVIKLVQQQNKTLKKVDGRRTTLYIQLNALQVSYDYI